MPSKATLASEKQLLWYPTKKNEVSAKLQTDSIAGSSEAASIKAEHNGISRARYAANPKQIKWDQA